MGCRSQTKGFPAVSLRVRYHFIAQKSAYYLIGLSKIFSGDFFMNFLLLAGASDKPSAFDFKTIFSNFVQNWYYYLILFAVIAAIILFCRIKKPRSVNRLNHTQKIVYVSVLTALSAAVNLLTYYPVSYIAITFTPVVCFVAGYLLGAKAGFAVGFIGDLIGGLLFPAGVYNPLIGVASGLMGFIPGIIFEYFGGNVYLKALISSILTLFICTAGINTFALYLMYGLGKKTYFAYLITRLPWQVLNAAVNCALCILFAKLLPKILKGKIFVFEQKVTTKRKKISKTL